MSEQAPNASQNHQEWLNSRSPDLKKARVEDVEKAYVMATASDWHETNAAGLRHATENAMKMTERPDNFEVHLDVALMNNDLPPMYRETRARTQMDSDHANYSAEGVVERITDHQAQADVASEFVGDTYDKLKATRR